MQAAQEIARHFAADPAHDGEEVDDEIINSPVGALQPKHEAVQALGIRPETAKAFGAGYSAELQGRFVIPIFDARGAYVSYTGIKRDESDFYPEKFDATHVLFKGLSPLVHSRELLDCAWEESTAKTRLTKIKVRSTHSLGQRMSKAD